MGESRYLIVTADDFGIGPATSRGILDLAQQGRVTATVLLVNSPHAEAAVQSWREAERPVELGWHPCLTLDRPVLSPEQVPTLVDRNGRFWSLGRFLVKLHCRRIAIREVEAELRAQYRCFVDMVGAPPLLVNSHHHVQVFSSIGSIIAEVCRENGPLPYLRNVCEPWTTLVPVPGARIKRLVLSGLGRRARCAGFVGNDWLAGITNPRWVRNPEFFVRWLRRMPGKIVEITCHPGRFDPTLIGRDCTATDGQLQRRTHEWHLLQQPNFLEAFTKAGFTLIAPSRLTKIRERLTHAA